MKFKMKNNTLKTTIISTITILGLTLFSNINSHQTQAAIINNDQAIYYAPKLKHLYTNYQHPTKQNKRKQVLQKGTAWKIIKTAIDNKGNKWYDLGKNQWVKVDKAITTKQVATQNSQINQPAVSQAPKTQVKPAIRTKSVNKIHYTMPASEAAAKAWIANHESGGSYSARNGQYIGKYQLAASYLHGNYSAANQERVANQYVKARYGSWTNAMHHWQANGSY